MNFATSSLADRMDASPVDTIRQSLEVMPRSRQLGVAALDLCNDKDRKVMGGRDFVVAVHEAIENIRRWAKGEELPTDVQAFIEATDEQLIKLQRAHRFSKLQLIQWTGEMKMQLSEARGDLHL